MTQLDMFGSIKEPKEVKTKDNIHIETNTDKLQTTSKKLKELHKAINPVKPVVRFLHDCKDLNKEFLKGSEWEIFKKDSTHYTILIDGTFYSPYKKHCEVIKI